MTESKSKPDLICVRAEIGKNSTEIEVVYYLIHDPTIAQRGNPLDTFELRTDEACATELSQYGYQRERTVLFKQFDSPTGSALVCRCLRLI